MKNKGCFAAGCAFAVVVAGLIGAVIYVAHRNLAPDPGPGPVRAPSGVAFDLAPETPPAGATMIVLIVDTSGSMNERISRGETKLAVAKAVLTEDFIPNLADDHYVALWRFEGDRAARVSPLRRNASHDGPGWLHREALMELVDGLSAAGGTPICDSLEKTRSAIAEREGRGIVVLLTDGEESVKSKADVLDEIEENRKAGIETYVVGFNLGDQGAYLADALGIGRGYFQANGGRDALLEAMRGILAAIEK